MKIAVVHNRVSSQDSPDARDVLIQAETVSESLLSLGHQPIRLSCSLDLSAVHKQLQEEKPDLIFNLVEDLEGHGRLIHFFPSLLDALRLPYTGSPAESIYTSSHKTLAKHFMRHNNLPTPCWIDPAFKSLQQDQPILANNSGRWIIKSLWEHASLGLDSDAVINTDSSRILALKMTERSPILGGACFAEEFIEGREFNLSLLDSGNGPEVLQPAEILFKNYTSDMVRIVDYQAKWEEDSFGYSNTVRSFDFDQQDMQLIHTLKDLAQKCWHVFNLRGYARVDFRVDASGSPFILEVNANPCLSPDAGFAAALQRSGIDFEVAVKRILSASGHSFSSSAGSM